MDNAQSWSKNPAGNKLKVDYALLENDKHVFWLSCLWVICKDVRKIKASPKNFHQCFTID